MHASLGLRADESEEEEEEPAARPSSAQGRRAPATKKAASRSAAAKSRTSRAQTTAKAGRGGAKAAGKGAGRGTSQAGPTLAHLFSQSQANAASKGRFGVRPAVSAVKVHVMTLASVETLLVSCAGCTRCFLRCVMRACAHTARRIMKARLRAILRLFERLTHVFTRWATSDYIAVASVMDRWRIRSVWLTQRCQLPDKHVCTRIRLECRGTAPGSELPSTWCACDSVPICSSHDSYSRVDARNRHLGHTMHAHHACTPTDRPGDTSAIATRAQVHHSCSTNAQPIRYLCVPAQLR